MDNKNCNDCEHHIAPERKTLTGKCGRNASQYYVTTERKFFDMDDNCGPEAKFFLRKTPDVFNFEESPPPIHNWMY